MAVRLEVEERNEGKAQSIPKVDLRYASLERKE